MGMWGGRSIIGASALCARPGTPADVENERFFKASDLLIASGNIEGYARLLNEDPRSMYAGDAVACREFAEMVMANRPNVQVNVSPENFQPPKESTHSFDRQPSERHQLFYHGTTSSLAKSITLGGLYKSTGGRLGPGLYMTPDINVATAVAISRSQGSGGNPCVVHVWADLGRKCDVGESSDGPGSWLSRFDSYQGLHPVWCGVGPFIEICVNDLNRCIISKVD